MTTDEIARGVHGWSRDASTLKSGLNILYKVQFYEDKAALAKLPKSKQSAEKLVAGYKNVLMGKAQGLAEADMRVRQLIDALAEKIRG